MLYCLLVFFCLICFFFKVKAFQVGDQIGARNRYRHLPLDAFLADYPRYPSVQEVLSKDPSIDAADPSLFLNLEPYLNPSPFVMRDESRCVRVLRVYSTTHCLFFCNCFCFPKFESSVSALSHHGFASSGDCECAQRSRRCDHAKRSGWARSPTRPVKKS